MVLNFLLSWLLVTPSIHVFLGRPLFLLSRGIQAIINFGILSTGILLTWPYHCSLFCSMISMMSDFHFTPTISFICSCPWYFANRNFLSFIINDSPPPSIFRRKLRRTHTHTHTHASQIYEQLNVRVYINIYLFIYTHTHHKYMNN